jgi:malate/lactate dehydrogenase
MSSSISALRRVIAQIDVSFSNSLIEAWWRTLKHQRLYLHSLDDLATVRRPVDVLTHVLLEATGLPAERVIGTGTLLDTARMRQLLASQLGVSAKSVHMHVIGEHGDSQVPIFSSARIGSVPLRSWPGWDAGQEPVLAAQIRGAARGIIARRGATITPSASPPRTC